MSDLPRVLCVDDEPHLLAALERSLFDRFEVTTATSAAEALDIMAAEEPFQVVVSDMRMPGMDGARFLGEVRKRHPRVIRVLLTGQADTESAIAAVNQGAIFKFLSKPCPADTLIMVLDEAIQMGKLAQLERQLLATTLSSAVKTLTEILGMVLPHAHRRSTFVRAVVHQALAQLRWPDAWAYEIAASLCQIGRVGLQQSEEEAAADRSDEHAEIAFRLLAAIPRLEKIALMVRYQNREPPEGSAIEVVRGATLLRGALLIERLAPENATTEQLLSTLDAAVQPFPDDIARALAQYRGSIGERRKMPIRDLTAGCVVDEDIRLKNGVLLLSKGSELSAAAVLWLKHLTSKQAIGSEFWIRPPAVPH